MLFVIGTIASSFQSGGGTPATDFDPDWLEVSFLGGYNGVDGDLTYAEESGIGAEATFFGTAQITNVESVLGGFSMDLTGTHTTYIVYPSRSDHDFTYGEDKTIRLRFKRNGVGGSGRETLIARYNTSGEQRSWAIWISEGTDDLTFAYSVTGSSTLIRIDADLAGVQEDGNWHEVALTYEGATDTYTLYFDGDEVASAVHASVPKTPAVADLHFSSLGASSASDFNGWIDECRISSFLEITGDYTVRTAEFPRVVTDELITFADSNYTGTDNTEMTLDFDVIGKYVVGMVGGSGAGGTSDSLVSIDAISTFDLVQLGTAENTEYEHTTWVMVDVTTAGTYTIEMTWQGTLFRNAVACWLIDDALDVNNYRTTFSTIDGYTNADVQSYENGALAVMSSGRGGTQRVTGFNNIDVANGTVMENTDFWMCGHETVALDTIKHIDNDSVGGTANRAWVSILQIAPYQLPVYSPIVKEQSIYTITGVGIVDHVSAFESTLYTITGIGPHSDIAAMTQIIYVIE